MSASRSNSVSTLRVFALATSSAMALAACRGATPPRLPEPAAGPVVPRTEPRDLDPDELLRFVRAREDRVSTLRARFTVRIRNGEQEDRELDGVVIVAKPDSFRMSLISPLGLSVFDHVANGDRSRTRYPMGPLSSDGSDTSAAAGEAATTPFSGDEMAEPFLRRDLAHPGRCRLDEIREDVVELRCATASDATYRTITIERAHGRIVAERSFRDGGERLHITLDDHHITHGVELPRRITMSWPDRDHHAEIRIRQYEINPRLDVDLFAVEPRRERR